jgi:hypothetical protein
VELADDDQDADAGEHAVDDGGGDGAEPLAEPEEAGGDLDGAGEEEGDAEGGQAVLLDEFLNHDGQTGRGAADLQGRPGDGPDEQAADDARD